MFCANCGNQIMEGTSFCGICGNPIQDGFSPVDMDSTVPGMSQQAPLWQQTPVQMGPVPKRPSVNGVGVFLIVLATVLVLSLAVTALAYFDVVEIPWLSELLHQNQESQMTQEGLPAISSTDATVVPPASSHETPQAEAPAVPAPAEIEANNTWVVGTSDSSKPFAFIENNQPTGHNVELTQRIAEDMGREYEIKSMHPDKLLFSLSGGTIDAIIAPLAVTSEMRSNYDVSLVYYSDASNNYAVILGKGSGLLSRINDLLNEYDSSGWLDELEQKWNLNSDYLLPNSNSAYLTVDDLKGLSQEECCLARNEIYARHHRMFTTPEIAAYFETKDWYTGSVSAASFNSDVLNEYEKRNVSLIKEYEKDKWGGSYY